MPNRKTVDRAHKPSEIKRRKRLLQLLQWSQAPETTDQVKRLWGLGPRILAEYFAAMGAAKCCMSGIAAHLSAFSQLPPKTVEGLGADRFVPPRPLLVPITETTESEP